MEEADQLADDIVVIDRGHQIAHGTADQLKKQLGGERMEVCLDADASMADARRILAGFTTGELHVQERCVTVPIEGGARTLTHACARWTPMASGCTTLACASPPWTMCSSP
jgi:ABC-2 type transport system ATP-binding protein